MRNIKLFDSGVHKFVLLNESEPGEEEGIRSNQYLVVHGDNGVLLDPGGFGVMPSVLTELLRYIKTEQIKAIILSHQDPDIVGGLSTWLELTDAPVYVSSIWLRFLPHYGIASMAQFVGVPDAGKQCRFAEDFVLQFGSRAFLAFRGSDQCIRPYSQSVVHRRYWCSDVACRCRI